MTETVGEPARQLEVGRLIVCAGLPGAGKSTALGSLLAGGEPELADAIGFRAGDGWRVVQAGRVPALRGPTVERLALHLDLRRFAPDLFLLRDAAAVPPVRLRAREVTLLTLGAPRSVLLGRLVLRGLSRVARARSVGAAVTIAGSAVNQVRSVARSRAVELAFARWLALCASLPGARHLVADSSGGGPTAIAALGGAPAWLPEWPAAPEPDPRAAWLTRLILLEVAPGGC